MHEPSLAWFEGQYFLTLRNDRQGYVTRGPDGLHFEKYRPWTFDDGTELGNYNTQQRWVGAGVFFKWLDGLRVHGKPRGCVLGVGLPTLQRGPVARPGKAKLPGTGEIKITARRCPMRTGMTCFAAAMAFVLLAVLLAGGALAEGSEQDPMTAAGKPAEGELEVFRGEPLFQKQILYGPGAHVRGPTITVAVDGTVLARGTGRLRRSEDGGESWGEPQRVPPGALIVDETTGDVLAVQITEGDQLERSSDHGRTWEEDETTLKPNEVMKWLEQTGLRERSSPEGSQTDVAKYYMHTGASESGITLRHGKNKGRLLNTATFRPHARAHPSDRDPVDAIYSCAIYSDDGGATWQVSGFFPEGYTEEAALAELQDGRIYYNSRSHSGYHGRSLTRELSEEETLRRTAWSYDGGQTWEDLEVSPVLPDGGGYGRGYGMMGGLVRLPVKDRDILIFSNADTAGGAREKMTVWASFDGGDTWPVKRLVYAPHGAYSSLDAGRPGTASEGQIYLLFEGGEEGRYTAIQVARFNLSWLLEGEPTGHGEVPEWLSQ